MADSSGMKYGVGHAKIDMDEAQRMKEEGASYAKIAARFGVSKQAVSDRFKKLRERDDDEPDYTGRLPWPWRFNRRHTDGNSTYAAFLSLLKMENGRELRPDELSRAKQIRLFADQNDLAITYDPDDGFRWVSRQPGEEGVYFVSRP